jgi:murein DD-endopeptidase MepM/ murein hydrolase activator NlpD
MRFFDVKSILSKFKEEIRFVVLKNESFDETFSWLTTYRQLFVGLILGLILLIILIINLIAFTPLKYYIPGYGSDNEDRAVVDVVMRLEQLEKEQLEKDLYIAKLQDHLLGRSKGQINSPSILDSTLVKGQSLTASEEEQRLRNQVDEKSKYSLYKSGNSSSKTNEMAIGVHFFPPLKGIISDGFNPSKGHFGVDVLTPKNQPIKSTLPGTITMAYWTAEDGYVLQIQHSQNIISVYKHNASLTKKIGDRVA